MGYEPYPEVIPVRRNTSIGGISAPRETLTLAVDMEAQSLSDIGNMIEQIILNEVKEQESVGNPLQRTVVDGSSYKPITVVEKKAVATFGNLLELGALNLVEAEINKQINKVSLISMVRQRKSKDWETIRKPMVNTSGWRWFIRSNKVETPLTSLQAVPSLAIGDALVFRPVNGDAVKLTSWLNHAHVKLGHVGGGRALRGTGFIYKAAQALRRKRALREFRVIGGYTQKFEGRGETWKWGSPFIVVVAADRARRRRFAILQ